MFAAQCAKTPQEARRQTAEHNLKIKMRKQNSFEIFKFTLYIFCCCVLLLDYNVDILFGINLINVDECERP